MSCCGTVGECLLSLGSWCVCFCCGAVGMCHLLWDSWCMSFVVGQLVCLSFVVGQFVCLSFIMGQMKSVFVAGLVVCRTLLCNSVFVIRQSFLM